LSNHSDVDLKAVRQQTMSSFQEPMAQMWPILAYKHL